jgi:hypothetical protein
MCLIDGDPCDVWIEHRVRARKRHTCVECGGPIPPGFDYIRVDSLGDGHWSRFAWHVECEALWKFVWDELCGRDGMLYAGGLRDEVSEYDSMFSDDGEVTLSDLFKCIPDGYRAMEAQVS